MELKKLLLLVLSFCNIGIFASSAGESNDEIECPYITDIKYAYQIDDTRKKLDCEGTLSFKVTVPAGYKYIIVNLTVGRIYGVAEDELRFLVRASYDTPDAPCVVDVSLTHIRWGCYFKVEGYIDNFYSDGKIFCTNDYMNPEDIQKILEQAPVEDVETSESSIRLEGKNLVADVSHPVNLIVADLNGRNIFSGELKESTIIPLDHVTSPFVVVRYTINDQVYTKKFIVR